MPGAFHSRDFSPGQHVRTKAASLCEVFPAHRAHGFSVCVSLCASACPVAPADGTGVANLFKNGFLESSINPPFVLDCAFFSVDFEAIDVYIKNIYDKEG